MNTEDEFDTQRPNDELRAMWDRWILAALALLRRRPQVVSQDYDVTLDVVGN